MSKISVIIPVHNTARYLPKTLESIYAQTFDDIEILLCENCSTDSSYALCDEIAASRPGVKVLHLDKADLSHARNCGIEAASSGIVSFIDSDDTVEPDMLKKMYNAMMKYDVEMVASGYKRVYDDHTVYPKQMDGKETVWSNSQAVFELLRESISNSACTILWKKSIFRHMRFPEGRFFEDNATTYRLASVSKNGVVYINDAFYNYIQRGESICHTLNFSKLTDFVYAYYEKLKFIASYFNDDLKNFEKARRHNERKFIRRFRQAAHLAVSPLQQKQLDGLRDKAIELYSLGLLKGHKITMMSILHFWKQYRRLMIVRRIKIK